MADGKIRVLYYGDSPTACTGFGTIARELITRLAETGKFEFTILGLNYYGEPHEFEGQLKIFPTSADDPQGTLRIPALLANSQSSVLWTVNDHDVLDWFPDVYMDACRQVGYSIPWLWYTAIDGEPLHASNAMIFRDLVSRTVVPCEYAEKILRKAIPILDIPQIPHGVDTNTFYRLEASVREELRARLGLQDKFVVFSAGSNQLCKQYGILLEAFAAFRQGKEDKVRLCLHTEPASNYGHDIRRIAERYGFADDIVFTNPLGYPSGIYRSQMPFVYNAADIAVFPHSGEGFGLCHLEAMACGIPVIAHAVGPTPEIVSEECGILVPTEQVPAPGGGGSVDLNLYYPNLDRGKHRPVVSLSKLVEAMETLYADEELRARMGAAGQEIAAQERFSWDAAAGKFAEMLSVLAAVSGAR